MTTFYLWKKSTNRKTVENWGFNNLGLECDEYVKVNLIYCKTCHEYYSSNNEVVLSSNLIKAQMNKFITGVNIIKGSNFSDHVKKVVLHLDAVNDLDQPLETPSSQTSIIDCVREMNQKLKDQLDKPFTLYSDIAHFEKDVQNVDRGNSYLTDTSCSEMLHFLKKSFVKNNITEPLNDGTMHYYSVHKDGS